ncbi:hypothetical protein Q7P37_003263 [Cladosporium fusiforme]
MSSTTARKPPVPGTTTARRQSTNPAGSSSSPSQSPSRPAAQTSGSSSSVNRTRSVRTGTGTPVSARAAARKPTISNGADSEAKAEMQVKMEELQEQLRLAEENSTEVQKQAAVLQVKLDEVLKETAMLEEHVHEHTERINDLENEKKESLRARREMEQIYESERAAFMKEREETQTKEEEMQASMQRMKEALAQREMRAGLDDANKPHMSRNSSYRNSMSSSPNPDAGQFAPPSIQRSDSRGSNSQSNSKLVMQKDKVIEGLRLELAEAQIKLVEVENMGGGRLQKIENEMYETKVQNARLMEENESFQLLLSEKTLNGDFSNSEFLRPHSTAGSRPSSSHPTGNSLADELEGEEEGEVNEDTRKLQGELAASKDQNKALTLYINNIISRLLQHDQFEQILDKTPDIMSGRPPAQTPKIGQQTPNLSGANTEKALPPPPPQEEEPTSLLQRARSVMGGKKPRPQSQIISSEQAPRVDGLGLTENPSTAPRIPLSERRSASGGHRRANSEWAPASVVVNNMYRGPSPGSTGPTSPGLGSPNARPASYFAAPQPLGTRMPSNSRMPSGNAVPTIDENGLNPDAATAGAGGPTSAPNLNRNSIPSRPSSDGEPNNGENSTPSSPPRSVTSSGDRESRAGGGGAVMVGSKMRPLRLVKEADAQQDEAAKKNQANRGSWFGWMNKGAPAGTQ